MTPKTAPSLKTRDFKDEIKEAKNKRNADLLDAIDDITKRSAPKKQKMDNTAVHIGLDNENERDINTLNIVELRALLLTTKQERNQARDLASTEGKNSRRLVKKNEYLDAVLKQETAAYNKKISQMSLENKELEGIKTAQAQLIHKLRDRLLKESHDLSNTEAKLVDMKLQYDNKVTEALDAITKQHDAETRLSVAQSKQEDTEIQLRIAKSQLENISTTVQGASNQSGGNSNHEDVETKLKDAVSQLDAAKSKQKETETMLKDTVSELNTARSRQKEHEASLNKYFDQEQLLRRQITTLEHSLRGWELTTGQARQANAGTLALSLHGIATQIEDRFNRVENAMAGLAKKGQDGFDTMTKQLSKKDS